MVCDLKYHTGLLLQPQHFDCFEVPELQVKLKPVHLVDELSLQQVGDGLEPTMRVIRESGAVVGVSGKLVQHQERVEVSKLGPTYRPPDSGPAAFALPDAEQNLLHQFSEEEIKINNLCSLRT